MHPNNLVNFINKEDLVYVAIFHSFFNIIPNLYFLVPDIYSIANLHPIHQYYKEKKALKALVISALASFFSGIFSLLFFYSPIVFELVFYIDFVKIFLHLIIIIFSLIKENIKQTILSIFLFLFSYFLIKLYSIFYEDKFFLLTGFFGLSSVLTFPRNKVKQELNFNFKLNLKSIVSFSSLGVIFSIPANIFPLVTPTHFLIILSSLIFFDKEKSIILVSSISTSDFILSIVSKNYYSFSRNYVVSEASLPRIEELFFTLFLAFIIFLIFSYLLTYIYNFVSLRLINIIVILSIFWPFFVFFDFLKLFFLFLSGLLGFICLKYGIERILLFNSYILDYLIRFL